MRSGCVERRARAILCTLTRVEGVSITLEDSSDGPVNVVSAKRLNMECSGVENTSQARGENSAQICN